MPLSIALVPGKLIVQAVDNSLIGITYESGIGMGILADSYSGAMLYNIGDFLVYIKDENDKGLSETATGVSYTLIDESQVIGVEVIPP